MPLEHIHTLLKIRAAVSPRIVTHRCVHMLIQANSMRREPVTYTGQIQVPTLLLYGH